MLHLLGEQEEHLRERSSGIRVGQGEGGGADGDRGGSSGDEVAMTGWRAAKGGWYGKLHYVWL